MNYDIMAVMAVNGLAGHWLWLDKLMVMVSQYGPAVFGTYLIGLWFSGHSTNEVKANRERAIYVVCSAVLALGINQVFGLFFFRERPYLNQPVKALMPIAADSSFPSDHSAGSFSIAGSIVLGKRLGGFLLMAFAVLVAVSRIYVGAHYPTDVIGGMIVGLMSSWIVEKNRSLLQNVAAKLISVYEFIEQQALGVFASKSITK